MLRVHDLERASVHGVQELDLERGGIDSEFGHPRSTSFADGSILCLQSALGCELIVRPKPGKTERSDVCGKDCLLGDARIG